MSDDEAECLVSPREALELISPFLDREWPKTSVKDIHVRRLTGGLINTLHLVSRAHNAAVTEPSAVLIRHFGRPGKPEEPTETSLTLSAAQQAIVYWEMGRRGWGPQVYGLFSGGRVEEYIPSHTLTAAEATQPEMIRDVARSYARLHSLDLPLRKDNLTRVADEMGTAARTRRDHVQRSLSAINDRRARSYASVFASTNWSDELRWTTSLFAKHNCRTALCHFDANYLNILVRDTPLRPSQKASNDNVDDDPKPRTLLIDYETTAYLPRGIDIGAHFNERQYTYIDPLTQLTGYLPYAIHEQRVFCEAYLEESRTLGVELGETVDTVEHLLLEAEIGRMYQILVTNLMGTVFNEEVESEGVFLEGLEHMMGVYEMLKGEFVRVHGP